MQFCRMAAFVHSLVVSSTNGSMSCWYRGPSFHMPSQSKETRENNSEVCTDEAIQKDNSKSYTMSMEGLM